MMLRKIISGGQTGADLAGLVAGKQLGLYTGGWIPRGFRTERGYEPDLSDYGLQETKSSNYPERTELNAAESDMTVWFGNTTSPGYRLTRRMALQHNRPFIVNPSPETLRFLVEDNKINVLNVAGNRESKNPGIGKHVFDVLLKAFGTQTEEQ